MSLIPEKIFLIFSLLFGFLFLILTPPFQAPDEDIHFLRAYQFSEGHLFGGNSPESITRSIAQFQNLPHHPEKKVGFSDIHQLLNLPLKNNITSDYFSNTLSPLAYVPQVLGITLGRILNLSPLLLM